MTAWPFALVPFSALTLLITTTVAALPVLLAPRRAAPLAADPSASLASASTPLLVIRTARGRWLVNGVPITAAELERQLRAGGQRLAIRFLPSPSLPVAEVRLWWRWLEQRSGSAVALALPSAP